MMRLFKIIALSMFLSIHANSASMKDTIIVSLAGGGMCKAYAEEVGGDVEAFSEINILAMQLADKMHYSDDLPSFLSKVKLVRKGLQEQLLNTHGTKLDVYNNWCIKFYDSFQRGVAQTIE